MHHDQVEFIPGIQELHNIRKYVNEIHLIKTRKKKNHIILSSDS